MKAILSALVALSVLTGVAAAASADRYFQNNKPFDDKSGWQDTQEHT